MNVVETKSCTIPNLGLGTWQLSGETCRHIVARALEAGYRHIDTAAMYGNEVDVGNGLRAASIDRDDVFVTTKVWNDRIDDGDLQASAAESLERLGLDHVDLLLIHWPNSEIPLENSIRALCDAKARGLARSIGVSNFPSVLLREALGLATEPIVCNQVEYHPYLTQNTLLGVCRDHSMALTAYAPIAKGRVVDDPTICDIAAKRGLTPTQVTLAWLTGQDNVVAIPKTANPERLVENLAGASATLDEDEMARISALGSPEGRTVNLAFAPQWDLD